MISPSSTAESAYTVINTAPQACPTVGSTWAASSNLPPIANPDLCNCMVSSLSCVAKSSVSLTGNQTAYLFDYICGNDQSACNGILANGTTGVYGAYSMCAASQKLSFVMNQYYLNQGKVATACDFSGNATTQSPSPASSCSPLLGAAGASGTGTVTVIPTGAGTISATGGSATASKSSIAVITTVPQFDLGMVQLGVYILVAAITGGSMILL
jgi:1,3-beta-glucanosyltransferase GAS1